MRELPHLLPLPSLQFDTARVVYRVVDTDGTIQYDNNRYSVPCPFCESVDTASVPSRIFSVNTQRNIYRCFKCGVSGNALDLWSTYHQLPLYTAAKELQAHVDQSSQPKNHS